MPKEIALLLIDVQSGFRDQYWGKRNNPQAEENIKKLLAAFRGKNKPVFHVQHLSHFVNSPLSPDQPGVEFMDFAVSKGILEKLSRSAITKSSVICKIPAKFFSGKQ
jgi:nicotinamidase-related amidase